MTVIIPLIGNYAAQVDPVDVDLAETRWFLNSAGYAIGDGASLYPMTKMHRVVMARVLGRALGRQEMVDHINHDRLDNRRENLRVLTNHENGHNRADLNRNNTSGYRGVYPVTNSAKWMAVITVNNRRRYLGVYPTPEAAAIAYDRAAEQLVGHVNRGNFR